MERAAARVARLAEQLAPAAEGERAGDVLARQRTAAHAGAADDATVALPEKLSDDTYWRVHRSTYSPRALVTTYEAPGESIGTLYDNFEYSVARHRDPFLGTRSRGRRGGWGAYTWQSYAEAAEARTALGSGLLALGVPAGAHVGLFGVNSADWFRADLALHAYGCVAVPLYDTLGADVVAYICGHAELAAVACDAAVLPTLLQSLGDAPCVRLVVVWGSEGVPLPSPPEGVEARVVTVEECARLGARDLRPHLPPRPSAVATISYTSGTTGVPKGAVLTHANLIANSAGCCRFVAFEATDVHVSYLPLAHIYERVNTLSCTHAGAAIGFYSGDVARLLDDLAALRPTVFASVPRLWNRIHDRVMAEVAAANPAARALFHAAFRSKRAALERGDARGGVAAPLWDALVFRRVKAKLGGRVRLLTTGASPISGDVMAFIRVCFPGALVLEGYGMTESACTICMTAPGDVSTGHVGAPLPCCEVKLADIPDMRYTHADAPHPRGEICVRGPIVFRGYHKAERQTAEVLDGEGWLHTGDVGTWLPGGRLRIIDRKKNIFKLAQGEYIAPEKLEAVFGRAPLVAQVFVYGDSLKAQLVAVAVPDADVLLPWAAERGMSQDVAALCGDAAVRAAVLRGMQQEGAAARLKGFEQVAAVHLTPEAFTVENGLLTPSFKLKRPQAKAAFEAALAAMYRALDGLAA